jgi:hypothetical protein
MRRAYDEAKRSRAKPTEGETFPEGWLLGDAERKDAKRIVGWDAERAEAEFEKFRDYHVEHDTRYRSWDHGWRNWCRKGVEIDKRPPSNKQQESTGLRSAFDGLQRWVDKRKAQEDEPG